VKKLEKILEQILDELKNVNSRLGNVESQVDKVESRLGSVESQVGNVESRLGSIESQVGNVESRLGSVESRLEKVESRLGNVESDVSLIKTQQTEHKEILNALRHSSDIYTAKLDNLEVELAKLSGEQKNSFEALANMYGHHEFEITKLKQVK
jgi:chromosome segregation ATPase